MIDWRRKRLVHIQYNNINNIQCILLLIDKEGRPNLLYKAIHNQQLKQKEDMKVQTDIPIIKYKNSAGNSEVGIVFVMWLHD